MNDWNTNIIKEFHEKGGKDVANFGDKLLLLTTKGAKTGEMRTTPLVYRMDGDRFVIVASKGGAPTNPNWFHNLTKAGTADIEVGTDKFPVHATVAEGAERERLYEEHAVMMPGFREYLTKTTRQIPVVVLQRRT